MVPTADCSDEEARQRILAGDRSALRILVERHQGPLMVLLRARCRPPIDPEDIAQEFWLRIPDKIALWNPAGGSFFGWASTVSYRVMLDNARQGKRRKETPLMEGLDPPAPRERQEFLDPKEMAAFRDCVERVGECFKRVLKLKLNGLSSKEIAEELQIPVKTVDTQHFRAKHEIRECVKQRLASS